MMKLILTVKTAKQLKKEVQSPENFIPDIYTWRVDGYKLVRRSIFIITHELSLYTCISPYKTGIKGILEKIRAVKAQNQDHSQQIDYLKFTNRSITSSMSNMKQMITNLDKYQSSLPNEFYEDLLNQTIFKILSNATPEDVYQKILSQQDFKE